MSIESFVEKCLVSGGEISGEEYLKHDKEGPAALLVSHDLSLSGAPLALLYMTDVLTEMGWQCIIAAPKPGPLNMELIGRGYPLLFWTKINWLKRYCLKLLL